MTPIPAMIPEMMALDTSHLLVNTLKPLSSDAARRTPSDWRLRSLSTLITTPLLKTYLSKLAVAKTFGEVDEEVIKEGDRVDEVDVGRGVGIEKTVLLITRS